MKLTLRKMGFLLISLPPGNEEVVGQGYPLALYVSFRRLLVPPEYLQIMLGKDNIDVKKFVL
jgi:hypothetical protein